jgi:hypothetical protein
MKFLTLLELFKERFAEANIPLVLFGGLFVFIILSFALWRWGAGVLMALVVIISGLLITNNSALNALALIGRFPLVFILTLYGVLSGRNRIKFSPAAAIWLSMPMVMLINAPRAQFPMDAMLQGLLYFLFFMGLVVGGQKILGDIHGRVVYTKAVVLFTIIITCIQIPFLSSTTGLLEGVFSTSVGYMIVGTSGVIVLTWFAMKQRVGSIAFLFFIGFAGITFALVIFTGGRTSIAASSLGVLVLMIRKLKRNLVVILALVIILGPVAFKLMLLFPGFEKVQRKLFNTASTGRAELYADAWYEIKQKPLTGWGTGTAFVKASEKAGMSYHQSYLEIAVDHGIPYGFIMMLWFVWFPFRGLLLMKKCPTEEMKDMANLSAAFLAGYVFSSFLGGVLSSTTTVLPIFTGIALQEGVRAEYLRMKESGLLEYLEYYDDGYYDLQDYCYSDLSEEAVLSDY